MRDLTRRLRYELPARTDLNLLFQRTPDGEVFSLAPYLQAGGFLQTPPWKSGIRSYVDRFEPRKAP